MYIVKYGTKPENEFLKLKDKSPDFRLLSLYLTNKCTCKCTFCHIWGNHGWVKNESDSKMLVNADNAGIDH